MGVGDPERGLLLTGGWNKKSQREFEFQVPRLQGMGQEARNGYWKDDARPHQCAAVSISTLLQQCTRSDAIFSRALGNGTK